VNNRATSSPVPRFSVVVPVYGNEGSIGQLVDRMDSLNARLGGLLEAVFVVDASPDRSGELLQELLPRQGFAWQLIWHSRNFGSFAAIRTGLEASKGEYRAAMAADLQEPAELILEFFKVLEADEADVVLGVRRDRQDPAVNKALSNAYWSLYRKLVNRQVPAGGVDIFACTSQVSGVLCSFTESHSSLVGLLFWVGFRRVNVPYDRSPRADGGKSAWSTRRKFRYMMDSLYSFTDLPISLMKSIGVLGVVLSLFVGLATLVSWGLGLIEVRGYTPVVLLLLLLSSLLLMCLGIVGSYVWRTYENSKGRPGAVVLWQRSSSDRLVGPGQEPVLARFTNGVTGPDRHD
jgi:polyisoprenyl-phosphate glycosyltransferase